MFRCYHHHQGAHYSSLLKLQLWKKKCEKNLKKFITCILHQSYNDQIKNDEMSMECSTGGGDQKCGQFWRENLNRLLGYPRSKYVRAYWRSRCIAPIILTFDTAREWSDSRPGCYTPPPPFPTNRRLCGPQSGVNGIMILKQITRDWRA
jgi:hypothetical protein